MKTTQFWYMGLRRPEDFRDPGVVRPFLEALVKRGFILLDLWGEEKKRFFHLWFGLLFLPEEPEVRELTEQEREALLEPRIWPELEERLRRFFSEPLDPQQRVAIDIYAAAREGELKGLDWGFTLYCPADEEEEVPAEMAYAWATEQFLNTDGKRGFWEVELPLLLYRYWRPLVVYLREQTERPLPRGEDERVEIRYLYRENLYSAEVVERLGRERLKETPGAGVEELEGGGLWLHVYRREEAMAYLGLEQPVW
uniref:Uncharacterized protein n=1 Tax=Thermogemmatispora argillosa TaxID=2045280 RepID=A0A455SYB1_9CHLR|nr:hypothetical protein KTA_08690 [Thermogemmatispora argillosa]